MTFFDFLKDLIDSGKERLKTPITGAFVFSFLVWNWRPIAVLFFSSAPIEDKIVLINHEYCTGWAIIFPVFIALFYTLLVPKIMVEINKELAPTKNKRVDDIYDSKEHKTDRRIKLAKKEFELKNIESGSKQIDELQNQIKSLEESKNQIINSNTVTMNQLNKKLNDSNQTINNFLKTESNRQLYINFKNNLSNDDWEQMNLIIDAFHKKLNISEAVSRLNNDLVSKLMENQYITSINNKYKLTESGIELIELL
jgi:hypothetical protein